MPGDWPREDFSGSQVLPSAPWLQIAIVRTVKSVGSLSGCSDPPPPPPLPPPPGRLCLARMRCWQSVQAKQEFDSPEVHPSGVWGSLPRFVHDDDDDAELHVLGCWLTY